MHLLIPVFIKLRMENDNTAYTDISALCYIDEDSSVSDTFFPACVALKEDHKLGTNEN